MSKERHRISAQKFGKMLIENYKYNDIIILNGRGFCDKDKGKKKKKKKNTCKNASVIDPVLSSNSFIKRLSKDIYAYGGTTP